MKEWYSKWDDFLNEQEEPVELSSTGNIKSWLSDRWETIKGSTRSALKKAIEELIESKQAGHLFIKYSAGKPLNPEEEKFLKEQAVDILRSVGLAGVVALPGGTVALKFLLSAAQKLNIEILPSSFRDKSEEDEAPNVIGGMSPGEYYLATYTQRI